MVRVQSMQFFCLHVSLFFASISLIFHASFQSVEPTRSFVQHCQKGGRATTAANQLADKYPNLVNFKGSMDAWLAENMPVEK